ncbi:MAG: hypothetical protein AAF614_26215 [Chloroflexota bacterium]
MLKQLNDNLERTRQAIKEKETADARLQQLHALLADQKQEVAKRERVLRREIEDVEQLEGITLAALFYTVMLCLEAELEKEEEAARIAQLRYDDALAVQADLKHEIVVLEMKLQQLGAPRETYTQLLQEKEQLLLKAQDEDSVLLLGLAEEIGLLKGEAAELKESISLGEVTVAELDQLVSLLKESMRWDLMRPDPAIRGNRKLTSKTYYADKAKTKIWRIKELVSRFNWEMRHRGERLQPQISLVITKAERFSDAFYDSSSVEVVIASRIRRARLKSEVLREEVTAVLAELQGELETLWNKQREIETVRQQLIESF